jgi:hypothetical protein
MHFIMPSTRYPQPENVGVRRVSNVKTKTVVTLVIKIVALTFAMLIIQAVASQVTGLNTSSESQIDPAVAGRYALLTSFLFTIALSYPIMRSTWFGWKLILTVAVLIYGIMTFLSQIETVVFLKYLVDIVNPEMIPRLFVQGIIVAVLFSPLAVWVHGKVKRSEGHDPQDDSQKPGNTLTMPFSQWAWKLALLAIIHILIYISFGQFVFMPLAGDAFEEFYAGLQMPQWILLLQAARALIWVALAVPVIRMMKGPRWEAGLAVALLFSMLMGALLLIPQDIMPDSIRMAHFVEVTSSNFLFGWIVVFILNYRRPLKGRIGAKGYS